MDNTQEKKSQKDHHSYLDKLIQDGQNKIKKHKFKSYNYFILFTLLTLCLTSLILIVRANSEMQTQQPIQVAPPVDLMTGGKSPLLPNQLLDWKTYTNTQEGFSFSYPPNWNQPTTTTLSTITEVRLNNLTITKGVYFNQNLNREMTFEEFIDTRKPTDNNIQDYTLAGIEGKKFVYQSITGRLETLLAIPLSKVSKNTILTVNYQNYPGDTQTSEIIDQILPTFQFLDQETKSEFECPNSKILDCSPCTNGPCPMFNPQYCSKGSAQYNWITENCPDVTIIGI